MYIEIYLYYILKYIKLATRKNKNVTKYKVNIFFNFVYKCSTPTLL